MFWKRKKKEEFNCSQCGENHEELGALAFEVPNYLLAITKEERESRVTMNDDFCIVQGDERDYWFIRVVLEQRIIDHPDLLLEYGVWVSLSEKSFMDYDEHFKSGKKTGYFGWFNNLISEYDNTVNIPCDVYATNDGQRPIIVPHEDHDHPFVRDFYNGISKEEAERRIHLVLKNNR